jgi:DNA polymerase-3 subunit delta'
MAFTNIIGQERPLSILKGFIVKGRIPHAILFTGDEGIGKRLTAVNFAKTLNCSPTKEDDLFSVSEEESKDSGDTVNTDACETCPSCQKIDKGNHPDVFSISPEGDGGQITVAAIRQLQESLSYKSFEGNWKIAIIDNAEKLNTSAANAFLQTLEEPSPQSLFILISSRPEMLLPTIRSRCQRLNFSPLPIDTMSRMLEEEFEIDGHDRASLLSTLSGGKLGYALSENLLEQREWSFDIFREMIGSLEEDVWENREAMEEWFDWAQMWLRDISVYKATGRSDIMINKDKIHEIAAIAGGSNLKDILKLARELYNIKRRLSFNLNKQLTLNYTSLLMRKMLGNTNDG